MQKREAGLLLCDWLSGRTARDTPETAFLPGSADSLVEWAVRYKVAALLYRELQAGRIPGGRIPAPAENRLRDAYRGLATTNTRLFIEAGRVLNALAYQNIPVVALKGLALAKHAYGDIALRPMADLDLLIREDDLVRAGRVLLTKGYRPRVPAWERMAEAYHHLPPFTNPSGTMIELHRHVVPLESPLKVDLGGLWERAHPITIDSAACLALSAEDALLHVCVHAGFHLRAGLDLVPFCDAAVLMGPTAPAVSWPVVRNRAAQWGAQKCAYLILLLARNLLGAAPPDEILAALKPADFQAGFLADALDRIFEAAPPEQMIRRIDTLSKIKSAPGVQNRVRALFRLAFPPKTYLAGIYPVSLSSPKIYWSYLRRLGHLLFYPLRLRRLARRNPDLKRIIRREDQYRQLSEWLFS